MTARILKDSLTNPIFRIIGETADDLGLEVYVVGGFVRDIFLKRHSADLDFVTVGSGIKLARAVADRLGKKGRLTVYATYGTAQIRHKDLELEFVGARKESYTRDSRNPIVEDGTLDDDQKRRDFTINAMAICLNEGRYGELVDPFDGLADLEAKTIRTPLDPDVTFSDDPLRMMRAIRFATQLEFEILPETFAGIKRNAERIDIITKERINDELGKIMRSRRPSIGFMLLDESGLLERIMPEVYALKGVDTVGGRAHKDNFLHTLKVVDNVAERSDNEWLRWAALLHDIAKPVTKKWDNT
ncbi:MAG: CCA tRNA nucleotidyltransferase, partial [Muribaculaceae bacterium]|nr:CCA tRNA nucleotidyltransferase [Muribaculaceae bacterium]